MATTVSKNNAGNLPTLPDPNETPHSKAPPLSDSQKLAQEGAGLTAELGIENGKDKWAVNAGGQVNMTFAKALSASEQGWLDSNPGKDSSDFDNEEVEKLAKAGLPMAASDVQWIAGIGSAEEEVSEQNASATTPPEASTSANKVPV